jgi:ABC-type bacteriocin/lantibiotic exporter with double-glycine peptidase domain
MPFSLLWQRDPGDLKMRIDNDAEKLTDFANVQTIEFIKALITTVVSAVMLLSINAPLALFAICAIPLTFLIDYLVSVKEKRLIKTNRINEDSWQTWLLSSIQGWRTIKSLNLQKHEEAEYVSYAHNFALYFGRWITYWAARSIVIPKIKDEFLMRFAVYIIGGLLIMNGELSIGKLLIFAIYFDLLGKSAKTVSASNAELQANSPIYDRVLSELSNGKYLKRKRRRPIDTGGSIVIRDLVYAYPDREPLFNNFSAEIRKGNKVAIIGKSGAGKTTLLKLLTGMLTPQSGQVLFNGEEVSTIDTRYLYSKFGVVMQETTLFNLSIRENLIFAKPLADQESIDRACKLACIDGFIKSLPNGYDTEIGERGVKLSGGQKQRLALARLLLRDVEVIFFDEATSALDQESEMAIFDTIYALGQEKTCIVISHRESAISKCERQIVL